MFSVHTRGTTGVFIARRSRPLTPLTVIQSMGRRQSGRWADVVLSGAVTTNHFRAM